MMLERHDIAGSASTTRCHSQRRRFSSGQGVGKPIYTAKFGHRSQHCSPMHREGRSSKTIDGGGGKGAQKGLGCWRYAPKHYRAFPPNSYISSEKPNQAETLPFHGNKPFTFSQHASYASSLKLRAGARHVLESLKQFLWTDWWLWL